ncbi:MAG: DUF4147 domain-containing protein, partial [Candidatus Pacebacteria bacterium]|nr:DUF4147 domain-containing protein [Candidatus Paceibacterota bacterium]
MTRHIQNFQELARTDARRDALTCVEAAYDAIDTEKVILNNITLEGGTLTIQSSSWNLDAYEHVYIIGFGKVACRAASVLEKVLGERVKDGAVVGSAEYSCAVISTYKGTHPLPSQANFLASAHIGRIGETLTERDLVLVVVGGGGSAMLCGSQEERTQGERLYQAFLKSGGTIDELNVVRRHISPLKGGGLAQVLHPATVIGLIFSDVVGGDPSIVASGPTYYDESTALDAQRIIDQYALGDYELTETPKDQRYFERVTNILLVSNETAVLAMVAKARELGYEPVVPECDPYASPDTALDCMMRAAVPHSVVCFGGEPRLVVPPHADGIGGRASATALTAVRRLTGKQVFVGSASDGHDNSEYAGAV